MTAAAPASMQQEFTTLLAETRVALRRRAIGCALARSIPAVAWLLSVGGFLALVGYGWAALVSITLGALWPASRAAWAWYKAWPSLADAAERLDATQDGHNRVATALAFTAAPHQSVFARQAIADGVETLRQCRRGEPLLQAVYVKWQAALVPIGLLLAGTLLYLVITQRSALRHDERLPGSTAEAPATASAPPGPGRPFDHAGETDRKPIARVPTGTQASNEPMTPRRARSRGAVQASADRAALGSAGAAGRSSGADAGGEGAASSSESSSAARAAASNRNDPPSPATRGNPGEPSRSQIRGAVPGASEGRATAGAADSRDEPLGNDDFVPGDEAEASEQNERNQQRGGLRASLLDRRAAASRELGITGPKSGRPGTGRGGPTPRKKSRGTASIIMGVPWPDFLSGQRRTGPVVTTASRAAPLAGSDAHPSVEPPAEVPPTEAALRPHVVAPRDAEAVKQYFQRWHGRETAAERRIPKNGEDGE